MSEIRSIEIPYLSRDEFLILRQPGANAEMDPEDVILLTRDQAIYLLGVLEGAVGEFRVVPHAQPLMEGKTGTRGGASEASDTLSSASSAEMPLCAYCHHNVREHWHTDPAKAGVVLGRCTLADCQCGIYVEPGVSYVAAS